MYDKKLLKRKIVGYLAEQGRATVGELAEHCGASADVVRRQLSSMSEDGLICKNGREIVISYDIVILLLKISTKGAEAVSYSSSQGVMLRERIPFSEALTYGENSLFAARSVDSYRASLKDKYRSVLCGLVYEGLAPLCIPSFFTVRQSREALTAYALKDLCDGLVIYASDIILLCKGGEFFGNAKAPHGNAEELLRGMLMYSQPEKAVLDIGLSTEDAKSFEELCRQKYISTRRIEAKTELMLDEREIIISLLANTK